MTPGFFAALTVFCVGVYVLLGFFFTYWFTRPGVCYLHIKTNEIYRIKTRDVSLERVVLESLFPTVNKPLFSESYPVNVLNRMEEITRLIAGVPNLDNAVKVSMVYLFNKEVFKRLSEEEVGMKLLQKV